MGHVKSRLNAGRPDDKLTQDSDAGASKYHLNLLSPTCFKGKISAMLPLYFAHKTTLGLLARGWDHQNFSVAQIPFVKLSVGRT